MVVLTCSSELLQVWNMAETETQLMSSVALIGKCKISYLFPLKKKICLICKMLLTWLWYSCVRWFMTLLIVVLNTTSILRFKSIYFRQYRLNILNSKSLKCCVFQWMNCWYSASSHLLVTFINVCLWWCCTWFRVRLICRERCEWRHTLGMVLSFCGIRLQTSSSQQVLFNTGQPGFPRICVWSVLSNVVLHYHCRGSGTYCSI